MLVRSRVSSESSTTSTLARAPACSGSGLLSSERPPAHGLRHQALFPCRDTEFPDRGHERGIVLDPAAGADERICRPIWGGDRRRGSAFELVDQIDKELLLFPCPNHQLSDVAEQPRMLVRV
jgi:hypothetical protein